MAMRADFDGALRHGSHRRRDVVDTPPVSLAGAPARMPMRVPMRGWIVSLVVLGVVFPLMGATMLAVWALDWMWVRRATKPLRQTAQ